MTKLITDENMKTGFLQEKFNLLFPFLKLDFLPLNDQNKNSIYKTKIPQAYQTLGEIRKNNLVDKVLTISPEMTVSDLERCFMETYGLGVQVLRKSGKGWLETTVTDGWTLEEQNKQGEELSSN